MVAITDLAAFVAGFDLRDAEDEAARAAAKVLGDFIGNCIGGASAAEATVIRDVTIRRGGLPEATILSSGERVPVVDAAYVNGAMADVFEFQDGYRFGGYHPSHVLPAVLGAAEARDASGDQLLSSVVVAYEVANRIARALHPQATRHGWFPLAAGFGAAAGVSFLRGAQEDEVASSLGAVPFFLPAIMIDGIFAGPSIKPAFAGQLARAGVEAAEHAAAGLSGWADALDAPRGLISLLTGSAPNEITEGLGEVWTILDVHQKGIAGCRHTHGAVEAALELRSEGLDTGSIDRIEVYLYGIAVQLVDRRTSIESPTSQCVLSLPYAMAAALSDGTVGPSQYVVERIKDPKIHRLAERVVLHLDQDLEARYPDETVTRVEITLDDGTEHTMEVARPVGDPRNPLSQTAYEMKLDTNLALSLDDTAREQVIDQLRGLSSGRYVRVRDLVAACVGRAIDDQATNA